MQKEHPTVLILGVDQLDTPQVVNRFNLPTPNPDGSPQRHPAWTATRATAQRITESAGRLVAAEQAVHAAAMEQARREAGARGTWKGVAPLPDPQAERRLRASARQEITNTKAAIEKTRASLGEHARVLHAEIVQSVGTNMARQDLAFNARAAEARAMLKSVGNPADKSAILNEAIRAGDREFIAGILAGSPILSGLDREAFAALREQAAAEFAPDQSRLLAGVEHLVSFLNDADRALDSRFGALTGEGPSGQAAQERALAALESNGGEA